jgi:hypothetical protein
MMLLAGIGALLGTGAGLLVVGWWMTGLGLIG